eukprot:3765143-Pyramimonas_sp.AAC.1
MVLVPVGTSGLSSLLLQPRSEAVAPSSPPIFDHALVRGRVLGLPSRPARAGMARSSAKIGYQIRSLRHCANLKALNTHTPRDDLGVFQL